MNTIVNALKVQLRETHEDRMEQSKLVRELQQQLKDKKSKPKKPKLTLEKLPQRETTSSEYLFGETQTSNLPINVLVC
jgi:hypothetical protein